MLDWQVKDVGGVSLRAAATGDKDLVARGWLLPRDHVRLSGTGESNTVFCMHGPVTGLDAYVLGKSLSGREGLF